MAELVFGLNDNGYYNTLVTNDGQLPPGGQPGQVLVKASFADFDCVWATPVIEGEVVDNGSGGTGTGGDIVLDSIAPIRVATNGNTSVISIDAASPFGAGSMSAADKRRLDNLPCTISDSPPLSPRPGDLWFDSKIGRQFTFYQDPSGSRQWVDSNPSGGSGQSVYVAAAPPVAPAQGQLWWDTTIGVGFIWYEDGSSGQWAPFTPQGGGQNGGDEGFYSS